MAKGNNDGGGWTTVKRRGKGKQGGGDGGGTSTKNKNKKKKKNKAKDVCLQKKKRVDVIEGGGRISQRRAPVGAIEAAGDTAEAHGG